MLKKILLLFPFFACLFFYICGSENVFAETLQEKLAKIRSWNVQVVDNQDITIELKLEDRNKQDIYLPIKVIWKNEEWLWYGLKYFWLKSSLESLFKSIPQNESRWHLEITNSWVWENWISKDIKVDLDYNKFNGTQREKRLLYYLQFDYNNSTRQYDFGKYYTQNDLEDQQKKDAEITSISIKGEAKGDYPIMWVDVGLYTSEWQRIESTQTDISWKYELKILDYQSKIEFWKTYYLIWQKAWNLENQVIWILTEWKEYKFRNNREILSTFAGNINLTVKLNQKDIVKSEDFPYILLIFLIVLYIWWIYIVFVKVIKKVFVHSLNWKSQTLSYEKREKKIKWIKTKLNISHE